MDSWIVTGMQLETASAHFPKDAAKKPKLDTTHYALRVDAANRDDTFTHTFLILQSKVKPGTDWSKHYIDETLKRARGEK